MSTRAVFLSLFFGFLLGAAGGIYYSWVVVPVKYVDTDPRMLAPAVHDEYLQLIASSYALDHDLARAQQRLFNTGDMSGRSVATLADRALGEGRDAPRLCALVALALALHQPTTALALCPDAAPPTPTTAPTDTPVPTPTPTGTVPPSTTPTATRRPSATPTSPPTPTPSATPRYLYRVVARQAVCRADQTRDEITVLVQDSQGTGLPGIAVRVSWSTAQQTFTDNFFTGLKPELDPGYADFALTPGTVYAVELLAPNGTSASARVEDMAAFTCDTDAGQKPGAWRVVFAQIGP